jgi:hypothetical protein
MPQIRSPCIGLTSPDVGLEPSELPMDTFYYQWVPFFLLFQVRKTLTNLMAFQEPAGIIALRVQQMMLLCILGAMSADKWSSKSLAFNFSKTSFCWCFVILQALLFRLPCKLWRHLEGGKMEEFGLEAKRHLLTSEASEAVARQYAESFQAVMHHNNPYFWQFVMCELLNMVVLFVVISSTDLFLGGQFWGYGWRVYNHYNLQNAARLGSRIMTPMCSLFPTVTS